MKFVITFLKLVQWVNFTRRYLSLKDRLAEVIPAKFPTLIPLENLMSERFLYFAWTKQ